MLGQTKIRRLNISLLAFFVLSILTLSTVNPINATSPPTINTVSINRERIYRGLQSLLITVNVTDDITPREHLKVVATITFADGLKLEKPMAYLETIQLYDLRLPIPSSAALGKALLKVTVADEDGMNSTQELEFTVLDNEPIISARQNATILIKLLNTQLRVYKTMGVNVTAGENLLLNAKEAIERGDLNLFVLENVEEALEAYLESISNSSQGLDSVYESAEAFFKRQETLTVARTELIDVSRKLSDTLALISNLKALGVDVSEGEAHLEFACGIIERCVNAIISGETEGVIAALQASKDYLEMAKEHAVRSAKDFADSLIKTSDDLLTNLKGRVFKPDLSYPEGLLAIAKDAYNREDYVTAITFGKDSLAELARMLKIASDQEFMVATIAVIMAIVIVSVVLLLRRPSGARV